MPSKDAVQLRQVEWFQIPHEPYCRAPNPVNGKSVTRIAGELLALKVDSAWSEAAGNIDHLDGVDVAICMEAQPTERLQVEIISAKY